MTTPKKVFILLPGAGGGMPSPQMFTQGPADGIGLETVSYPTWQRTSEEGYSAAKLVAELADETERHAGTGPVRIIGISMGAHLAYAVALALGARGREIGGLCFVDSFFAGPPEPALKRMTRDTWRALATRSPSQISAYVRGHFWRRYLPLWETSWQRKLRASAKLGRKPLEMRVDPIAEFETNMRLLLKLNRQIVTNLEAAPPVRVPALLLRTRANAGDDAAWCRRCPRLEITDIPGSHNAIFEAEPMTIIRKRFQLAASSWT